MAITVKDIQEKVFPIQASNGYDVEQVDDFLDEITEQLTALIRENIQLKNQVAQISGELAAKEQALNDAAAAAAQTPDYNEAGYFKNLQSTMRDTLISAQRVADDTISAAKAEAEKVLTEAKTEADHIMTKAQTDAATMTERAQSAAAAAKAEYESLKASADNYRASFRKLVEDQLQVLKASDILFK